MILNQNVKGYNINKMYFFHLSLQMCAEEQNFVMQTWNIMKKLTLCGHKKNLNKTSENSLKKYFIKDKWKRRLFCLTLFLSLVILHNLSQKKLGKFA